MVHIKADTTFGQSLRHLRLSRGLTQEQVVASLQVEGYSITRTVYSKIENGTHGITVEFARLICKILDVTFDDLFRKDTI